MSVVQNFVTCSKTSAAVFEACRYIDDGGSFGDGLAEGSRRVMA